ncbi:hypothetical protein AMTRI_Chr04g247100 [Amborella trichopoda]|uniref:Carboxypeptidase n=1 Tax=Amborella trichopoda TaxID=13333 RepID=W1NPB9_AMBTC|nr:serine carboxypeptidase II-3 [Amborella trichopoda]ERM97607.1 hypothetical protein AMTR_s00173p00045470 [Amborella trichopoda]|eukprot:XP_006830191.1 serine carboxypeptidase II-3 [Amborella trichopoda]
MRRAASLFPWLSLLFVLSSTLNVSQGKESQGELLYKLIKEKRGGKVFTSEPYVSRSRRENYSPVYVAPQDGLKAIDKIEKLPGQPQGVDFEQYSGYVTVDPTAGRALFYYFVESPADSATKPLVIWLNGGPGCSSLGYGAMEELGPFRVMSDGKTLFRNPYAWNQVANMLFLESPAGVGFSYSNTSSDYKLSGDKRTARDAYTFLVNWLERFPEYKTRDFFITGESYAGHYVPQLAYTILTSNNSNIKFKGIAIGNAWIDDETNTLGMYDYFWTHALISDDTIGAIHTYCDFSPNATNSDHCDAAVNAANSVFYDQIDIYNIYAPLCHTANTTLPPTGSIDYFDPCSSTYVENYLNLKEVQAALHAKPTSWTACSGIVGAYWNDSPATLLPTIRRLLDSGISVWIYSGDIDGRVPVTSSRYSVNSLNLTKVTPWHSWYLNEEVAGYVEGYKGLALVTVRGAGHTVPSYQPARALAMLSFFLQNKLPTSP